MQFDSRYVILSTAKKCALRYPRSVELSWSPPLHSHSSSITHYQVHYVEGEQADWADSKQVTIMPLFTLPI